MLVEAVIRHDPKTYECHLTPVGFFGKTIQPIVTGIVKDDDEHFLKVERAEFKCNDKFIERICNDKIKVSGFMTLNVLQEEQESIMHADSEMKVQIGLPKFFPLGKQVFQNAGNLMITSALDGAIKKFLETIENDYQDWSMEAENRPSWAATEGKKLA